MGFDLLDFRYLVSFLIPPERNGSGGVMQQRRLRLGDILDDYCPRERRITNHAVVAMIDDQVKQTRCTTCNECTEINDKMFVYDDNKQAYIADLDAGTYGQMVEAAEACQVAIIHPGKPWNPDEPNLDQLIARAEPFR